MACRCNDLDIYKADRAILKQVKGKINELVKSNSQVEEDLATIAGVIPDTLIIPDETFCYDVKCVNNKCTEGIGMMYHHVAVELEKLEKEIDDAEWEDFTYHITHPVETVQSWFGD